MVKCLTDYIKLICIVLNYDQVVKNNCHNIAQHLFGNRPGYFVDFAWIFNGLQKNTYKTIKTKIVYGMLYKPISGSVSSTLMIIRHVLMPQIDKMTVSAVQHADLQACS